MATNQNAAMTLTQKIISIAVIIIVISAVALPTINSDFSQKITHYNTDFDYRMAEATEASITVESAGSAGKVVINGVTYTGLTAFAVVAFTDDLFVRLTNGGGLNIFCNDNLTSTEAFASSVTFSDGSVTWTDNAETTHTKSYSSKVFRVSDTGNYGAFYAVNTPDIFLNSNSILWAFVSNMPASNSGLTPSSITVKNATYHGTYDNMDSTGICVSTADVVVEGSVSDLSPYMVSHDSYLELQNVDNVPATVTTTVGDYTGVKNYYVVAPIAYVETTGDETNSLFGVVAILLILVPVMMAVRMITLKRN